MGFSPAIRAGLGDPRLLSLDVLSLVFYLVLGLECWICSRNGIVPSVLHRCDVVGLSHGPDRESAAQIGR